jgi:hypothetical protein
MQRSRVQMTSLLSVCINEIDDSLNERVLESVNDRERSPLVNFLRRNNFVASLLLSVQLFFHPLCVSYQPLNMLAICRLVKNDFS